MPVLMLLLSFLPSANAEVVLTQPVVCTLSLQTGSSQVDCDGLGISTIDMQSSIRGLDEAAVEIADVTELTDVFGTYTVEGYAGEFTIAPGAQSSSARVQLARGGYEGPTDYYRSRQPRTRSCRVSKSGYYKKGAVVRCR